MISGYHGNVDSVLTCLLLLAAQDCNDGRAAACGVWLGLACNVKVIPLLVAPVFFFFWLARGRAKAFFLPAMACIVAGWAVPLIALPKIFLSQVLGYGSNWGSWGIPFVLRATGLPAFAPLGFTDLTPAQSMVMTALKVAIVVMALWIAWHRRTLPASALFSTLAFVWAAFFVLAPGVGAQYLVWIAPFLLVESAAWYATITVASSVFLGVFYQTISGRVAVVSRHFDGGTRAPMGGMVAAAVGRLAGFPHRSPDGDFLSWQAVAGSEFQWVKCLEAEPG